MIKDITDYVKSNSHTLKLHTEVFKIEKLICFLRDLFAFSLINSEVELRF